MQSIIRMSKWLAVVCGLGLVASVILSGVAWSMPLKIETQQPLVKYYHSSQFDYLVTLAPSDVFESGGTYSSSSHTYPMSIVRSLDFEFRHLPSSDQELEYSIQAIMENPGIWHKAVELVPVQTKAGDYLATFSLDMNEYLNKFTEIEDVLGISTSRSIKLIVTVKENQQTYAYSLPVKLSRQLVEINPALVQRKLCGRGIFSYAVNLLPNPVYDEPRLYSPALSSVSGDVLEPGEVIFTRMVDTMDVNYRYRFTTDDRSSDIQTESSIRLILGAGDLWSRELAVSRITGNDEINANFSLDLAYLIEMMADIRTETGVPADTYTMELIASTDVTASTGEGAISETFTHSLKGNISRGMLQWDAVLSKPGEGSISETVVTGNPARVLGLPVNTARYLFIVTALILLAGLAWFGFNHYSTRPLKTLDNTISQINKKYGDRIVTAIAEFPIVENQVISLESIEELVNVADELGKPIVYAPSINNGTPHVYYVLDSSTRYQYLLK